MHCRLFPVIPPSRTHALLFCLPAELEISNSNNSQRLQTVLSIPYFYTWVFLIFLFNAINFKYTCVQFVRRNCCVRRGKLFFNWILVYENIPLWNFKSSFFILVFFLWIFFSLFPLCNTWFPVILLFRETDNNRAIRDIRLGPSLLLALPAATDLRRGRTLVSCR